jgi:glycosyltransferase involved in cell wall biosynthesis
MDLPLVSIIITTYNYAHMVATAIESALGQDYPNFEVVIMDNASTDDTPAVIRAYAADPRVRYIRNPENIGLTPNHNAGLREARGQYVSFLSADDWLMPSFVSRAIRYYQDHPDVDVLYSGTYLADESGNLKLFRKMLGEPPARFAGRNEFAALLAEGCHICFPSMLVKREHFERYGDLDPSIKAADYEIVIRWAAAGLCFAHDPEPTCVVRLHPNQNSGQINYTETGGKLGELLYLLQKYIVSENCWRIEGYEYTIARHLASVVQATQKNGLFLSKEWLARVDRMNELLLAARAHNLAQHRPTFLTIAFYARGPLPLIELTMRSLAALSGDGFEVLVLHPPGSSTVPLAAYLDRGRRFRTIPLTETLGEAAAMNLAIRVGIGNAFTFLECGNTFESDHAERLRAAFDQRQADVVLSPARVSIEDFATGAKRDIDDVREDLYAFPSLDDLAVRPALPLESIAFRRSAADAIGNFNETLPVLVYWEYFLRLSTIASIVAQPSPVTVRAFVGRPSATLSFPQLPDLIAKIHAAYPGLGDRTAERRTQYVREIERGIETRIYDGSDPASLMRQIALLAGTHVIADAALR